MWLVKKTTIYTYFGDKAGLFTAIVDELLKDTVAFSDSFNPSGLNAPDAIYKIADQHLKVVLSERYIRLARLVVAEVNQFPELGKSFYEHGPGRSYDNFKTFLVQRMTLGELQIKNTSRATDPFFDTLLHREFLVRLYGTNPTELTTRKSVARKITDEFMAYYGPQ